MSETTFEAPAASSPPPLPPPPPRRRSASVLAPLLLIAVGGLLLAANFGYAPPISPGQLFRLWPLILVLVGIDFALGRMPRVALAVETLVIGAAIASLVVGLPGSAASGGASSLIEAQADVNSLRHTVTRTSNGDASVRIDQVDLPFTFGPATRNDISVRVASDLPTALHFDAGAGEFTLDLSAVRVTSVQVAVGAASLRVVLPKPEGDVPVRISAGASSVVIETPAGVEASVRSIGGLSATRSDGSRLVSQGGDFVSPGYAQSRDRVTVRIEAGVSSVSLG